MNFQNFIYRQKSRWQYHLAKDDVERRIAEINQYERFVETRGQNYYIPKASIQFPKGIVDSVFLRFDLFIENMYNLNGKYSWESGRLYFLFDTFKIRIVTANELFILNEVFFAQCYNFKRLHDQPFNVIDVGMNVGLASLFFASKSFVNHVFSFEPFLQSFEQAKDNFEENLHVSFKIKPFNFGLGRGKREEHVPFNPLSSGTSGVMLRNSSVATSLSQQLIMIRDAWESISAVIRSNEKVPFVLKIDCEGSEYEIMESLFAGGLSDAIVAILMEWHGGMPEGFEDKITLAGFSIISTRLQKHTGLIYAVR